MGLSCARADNTSSSSSVFVPVYIDTVRYRRYMNLNEKVFIKSFLKYQRQFLNQKKVTSPHGGEHWTNCIWSHADVIEGPDTCVCSVYELKRKIVEDILSRWNEDEAKYLKYYHWFLNTATTELC